VRSKFQILLSLILGLCFLLLSPSKALAVVQSLNGQTGQTQTFQNDSNFSISSLNNVHKLIWQGVLPVSRGGTGASSFTNGSILFSNGTSIAEDNANLFWDDTNKILRLGSGNVSQASIIQVFPDDGIYFSTADATVPNTTPLSLNLNTGSTLGNAHGAGMTFSPGPVDANGTGDGANIQMQAGQGGGIGGNGGELSLTGGEAEANGFPGGPVAITGGNTIGSGTGGEINLMGGNGGNTGNGGEVTLIGGTAGGLGYTGGGNGGSMTLGGGDAPNPSGNGGDISFQGGKQSGTGSPTGRGGNIQFTSGYAGGGNIFGSSALFGGGTLTSAGSIKLTAGTVNGIAGIANGGNISLEAGQSHAVGGGLQGVIEFTDAGSGKNAIFGTSLLNFDRIFAFPDTSGTFGLLQADQTWNGLNKFESSSNSTIYVGSSIKSGCIALGDSDGSGITYITANDGVLSASSTKPSLCQ